MIVTFTCNVDADVIMMDDQAKPILGTAGKDVSGGLPERGVFTEDQLVNAIARLEAAIKAETPREHVDNEDDDDDQRDKPKTEVVLLAQRVYPLLSMMKKAQSANTSVMWETSSGW